jgi:hypothetical protein
MSSNRTNVWSAARVLVIVALAAAGLALARPVIDAAMLFAAFAPSAHPSDAALTAQLKSHRAELEELVGMAKKDPQLTRLGMDFTPPDDPGKIGVPPERLARYRELFRKAGITYGLHRAGEAIFFIVHTEGWFSGKGLLYQEEANPDAEVVADTDAAYGTHETRSNVTFQHQIEGPWWVQLDVQ